jgi:hypothetical protein
MSGIVSLTQLIHSLSKAERRSFSQYAALQFNQKPYLSLYEVILKTKMKLPAASGRGILVDNLFFISPQAAGNLPKRD